MGSPSWERIRPGVLGTLSLAAACLVFKARDRIRTLERRDQGRDRLIAAVAHDVRGPLATIRMLADTLAREGEIPEVLRRDVADRIAGHSQRLISMADDFLDCARMDAGALVLDRRVQEAERVLTEALAWIRPKGELRIEVEDDLQLFVDPERFAQIVSNLVSNAFAHGAPPVELEVRSDGDAAVLRVRDHGEGVPGEQRDQLFRAFAGSGESSVGLGLWIASRLVEAHGGHLVYEDADDGGALMTVVFPHGVAAPAAAPART